MTNNGQPKATKRAAKKRALTKKPKPPKPTPPPRDDESIGSNFGDPIPEWRRCTAKAKQTQQLCGNWAVRGRHTCKIHGGNSGRPAVTGRYSRSLVKFRKLYEEALNDPTLWDLSDHLAVLDGAVRRAAERLTEHDTPDYRKRLRALMRRVKSGNTAGNAEKAAQALTEMESLVDTGATEDEAFAVMITATDRLAKRLESAWKIKLDAAQALNARDMVAVLGRFADIVQREAGAEVATRIFDGIDTEILEAGQGLPSLRKPK